MTKKEYLSINKFYEVVCGECGDFVAIEFIECSFKNYTFTKDGEELPLCKFCKEKADDKYEDELN